VNVSYRLPPLPARERGVGGGEVPSVHASMTPAHQGFRFQESGEWQIATS
jgi:hypothetical protein